MMASPSQRLLFCSIVFATTLLPRQSPAAPAPTFESVASLVTTIPAASAVTVLRMMKPEGFKPDEVVQSFEVQPWGKAANTWLALLAVDGCAPLVKASPTEEGYVPSLWLALVHLPPAPARPTLLARPIGGFMQAREHTGHRYTLGEGPMALAPGKQAFVVSHGFSIPFAGGGADVTVDHVFLWRQGDLALVFNAVSNYDAMYGGDWNEDGSRNHTGEAVSLTWEISKKTTDGFFNVLLRDAEAGPRGRRALYTWRGDRYATAAEDMFGNQEMCLDSATLTPPPLAWQTQWLRGEFERLLDAGDIDGVMGLDVAFQDVVRQDDGLLDQSSRARILTLAHQTALARIKTAPAQALRLLGYGICQLTETQGIEARALEADPPLLEPLLHVAEPRALAALNDYAFILAKKRRHAAKAISLLRTVLDLDPTRKVAHLNLADTLWSQGKKDEARAPYRRYLDLSATGATDVPARVRERAAPASPPPRP